MHWRSFETIVVGGGPAGLVCALELARQGRSVALVEKGGRVDHSLCPVVARRIGNGASYRDAAKARSQCGRCNCLHGVGGAALHFDSNLGYVRGLTRAKIERDADGAVQAFSHLERTLGSMERAAFLVRRCYELLAEYGLPLGNAPQRSSVSPQFERQSAFEHIDTSETFPMTLEMSLAFVRAVEADFEDRGGVLLPYHRSEAIEAGTQRRWRVVCCVPEGTTVILEADNVVLAVGKIALPWLTQAARCLEIAAAPSPEIEVGVRLEARIEQMEPLIASCDYPKLSFISKRGDAVRTFCLCAGGRLMQYEFAGAVILDGQHCYQDPTSFANMGIITRAHVEDGTQFGLEFARRITAAGSGQPLVQTVGDFLRNRPTDSIPAGVGTLRYYTAGNLRIWLPDFLVEDVCGMIERLNTLFPGTVRSDALLAAPVVERVQPDFRLTEDLSTNRAGIYMVGDCSGKVIGITYGAATGLQVADSIANG